MRARGYTGLLLTAELLLVACSIGLVLALTGRPWFLLPALAAAAGLTAEYRWATRADRWRGFHPEPGEQFTPGRAEVPLLADHRGLFGPGTARNAISGPGFVAFELVGNGIVRWFYVVPLAADHGRWRTATTNGQRDRHQRPWPDPAASYGPIPPAIDKALFFAGAWKLTLRLEGDLLIASEFLMSPARYRRWNRSEGELVRTIARMLESEGAVRGSDGAPAVTTGDPARNVWTPGATPSGTATPPRADPVWRQPPGR